MTSVALPKAVQTIKAKLKKLEHKGPWFVETFAHDKNTRVYVNSKTECLAYLKKFLFDEISANHQEYPGSRECVERIYTYLEAGDVVGACNEWRDLLGQRLDLFEVGYGPYTMEFEKVDTEFNPLESLKAYFKQHDEDEAMMAG